MMPWCFRDSQVHNNVQGFFSALSDTISGYSFAQNLHVSLHQLWGPIIIGCKIYGFGVSPNHVWQFFLTFKLFLLIPINQGARHCPVRGLLP